MTSTLHERLSRLYRDPTFPGAFKGLTTFYSHLKKKKQSPYRELTWKEIQEWKKHDALYSKYKASRTKKFLRRSYKIFNPNNIWEGDLMDMSNFAKWNKGFTFVLVLIDQFTRKMYAYQCKSKHKEDVLRAFQNIFEKQTMSRPHTLYTDNGGEFKNDLVRKYLQQLNIQHVTTKDKDIKCAIVERANRTLKKPLQLFAKENNNKYLDHLQNFVQSFNNNVNRSTGMTPNSIDPITVNKARINMETAKRKQLTRNLQQKGKVWDKNLQRPLLHVGDWVRIAKERQLFRRGFQQQFTDQLYQITEINNKEIPITYKIADLSKEPVLGYFTYPELSVTVFPTVFHLTDAKAQQFKNPEDGIKYVKVKIAEYWNHIWVPEKILQQRNASEKKNKTISSATFMKWLND